MPTQRRGRTPGEVYGHSGTATAPSVRVWTASDERVTVGVWQLWERVARSEYLPGEPLHLTEIRDELERARDSARLLHELGTPALLPAHVVNALRIAGWVK